MPGVDILVMVYRVPKDTPSGRAMPKNSTESPSEKVTEYLGKEIIFVAEVSVACLGVKHPRSMKSPSEEVPAENILK